VAVLVDEHGPPAEELGEGVGDVVDPATAEHEGGEAVVGGGRLLHALGILPDRLVGVGQRGQCVLGVGEGARLHEGDCRQGREVAEKADLLTRERTR
jgi:hypothetical protein